MKKLYKVVAAACGVMLVAIIISLIFSDGIKYEVIGHGEMEKSHPFSAIVIRDETVIEVQKEGVLESLVDDGEMVRKNKHVASIYESKIDDSVIRSLERINARIEEIRKVQEQFGTSEIGAYQVDGAMDIKARELFLAGEEGNMKEVVSLQNELNLLNDRKNALEKGVEYTDATINSLLEEKKEAENKLGSSKEDIYSHAAGVYTTKIDGYEKIVTPDAVGEMTPYDFETIKKMKIEDKDKNGVCKIIEGTKWSVAFCATAKEISKLKEGSLVYIRAKNYETDSAARITYISTPVNGNYLVIATSNESCSWALNERFCEIDLIRSKYSGLKVPVSALRVKDGQTGVYTVVDGIVHFKKVNILYRQGDYAIAEENNSSSGSLLLYDEVITASKKELKVGERIS